MGLFDKFRKKTEQKTLIASEALLAIGGGEDRFADFSREGYEACSTVYRCVNLIGQALASLEFVVVDTTTNEAIPNHPLLNLLRRPQEWLDCNLGYVWTLSMLLGGQAFVWGNGAGETLELVPIPPTEITPRWGTRWGEIIGFDWTKYGKFLPPDEVLYSYFPHPRDYTKPLAPLKAAAREVDVSNEAMRWNLSLLLNSQKPPYWIGIEKGADFSLTDEQLRDIKRQLREDYGGARNVGKVLVLNRPGLRLEQYGWSPQEMDWLRGVEKADVRIANVFNIPPELVGGQKTYENFRIANRVFWESAVIPLAKRFCDELTYWNLLKLYPTCKLTCDWGKIPALQEDEDSLIARLVKLVEAGIITRNEARQALRLPRIDDPAADSLTVPSNVIPLAMAGEAEATHEEQI